MICICQVGTKGIFGQNIEYNLVLPMKDNYVIRSKKVPLLPHDLTPRLQA